MKVEIIAVGTELLLGDIVNTNAQYLAQELSILGLDLYYQRVIGDNKERLKEGFDEAFKRSDIIITTGGLGPTEDDLTKETAAEYFNKKLVLHEESEKSVRSFFDKIGKTCTENNLKQAYFPEDSIILTNNNGTAPGAIIKNDLGKVIIILPGPPKEMIPMFEESVKPYLKSLSSEVIESKTLKMLGIGESEMATLVQDLINCNNPTVAPYAKEKNVQLRITAKAKSKEEALSLITPVEEEIRNRLNDYIYGIDNENIEDVVGKILVNKKLTISSAESCTGGLIAATLINYPGISEVFLEGIVTYSNKSKVDNLKVKEETLNSYGAVSEQVAREMAIGIKNKTGANIGISTTGIAGPGGGTEEKPVGLVYIGICIENNVYVYREVFNGDRQKVRERATITALNYLRKLL